jgi:hypothetical protein
MLAQIKGMIETIGLQIGFAGCDFGQGRGQNVLGHICNHAIGDFMNEADVALLRHARDHLSPGDVGINHGFAAAPAVVDHHDEILHAGPVRQAGQASIERGHNFRNRNFVKLKFA